jgi:hypothetical protein
MTTPFFPANEADANRIVIERRFPDGRLAEVLDLGTSALVRVHAPSGKIYIEQTFASLGEATAAMGVWDGEGLPGGNERQRSRSAPGSE